VRGKKRHLYDLQKWRFSCINFGGWELFAGWPCERWEDPDVRLPSRACGFSFWREGKTVSIAAVVASGDSGDTNKPSFPGRSPFETFPRRNLRSSLLLDRLVGPSQGGGLRLLQVPRQ
jgi:hypothetical protein